MYYNWEPQGTEYLAWEKYLMSMYYNALHLISVSMLATRCYITVVYVVCTSNSKNNRSFSLLLCALGLVHRREFSTMVVLFYNINKKFFVRST